jgi:UDP-N-acetylmuramate dehydrogenase
MMTTRRTHDWRDALPAVRGRISFDAPMAPFTWFRVGGPAEVLFRPADMDDLIAFLTGLPPEIPVTTIGVGSNLLVRDGGVPGCPIPPSLITWCATHCCEVPGCASRLPVLLGPPSQKQLLP